MLSTVVLLLLSALTVLAGIPLILKLIPRNEFYGVRTEKALSRDDVWYEVNRFCGWALVIAATCTLMAILFWANTLLRPVWRQLLMFIVPLCIAVGATLWYERNVEKYLKARPRRSKRKVPA